MKKNLLVSLLFVILAACNASDEKSPTVKDPIVKKSTSGICHDKSSGSYNRTENFTPFDSIKACLASGGRLPAGQENDQDTAYDPSSTEYEREYFGHGWTDDDGDCINTRHEILISHALNNSAEFKEDNNCTIAVGQWESPFTGNIIESASAIDIDHIAPLKFAWTYGADSWTEDKRLQFANDPENLLAVEASLNRQKGAQDITEWLPPKNQCRYIEQFLAISKKYGLVFPQEKRTAFENVRKTHCS